MTSEGDEKNQRKLSRFVSPAGVEWTVGSRAPISAEEFRNRETTGESHPIIRGESLKNPGTVELVAQVRETLKDYLHSQGIDRDTLAKLDFVVTKGANLYISVMAGGGAWLPETDSIQISERRGEERSVTAASHELAHASSKNKIYLSNVKDEDGNIKKGRSGLSSRAGSTKYFELLNEAVTDEIRIRALRLSDDELHRGKRGWLNKMMILLAATESQRRGSLDTPEKVWKSFVHSYVYGWRPELKNAISNAYGKAGMQILAEIDSRFAGFEMGIDHQLYFGKDKLQTKLLIRDIDTFFASPNGASAELGASILTRLRAQ